MSDGPYTEPFPLVAHMACTLNPEREVVPFSDAERMRGALARLLEAATHSAATWPEFEEAKHDARAALNPEQHGNALGKPITGTD